MHSEYAVASKQMHCIQGNLMSSSWGAKQGRQTSDLQDSRQKLEQTSPSHVCNSLLLACIDLEVASSLVNPNDLRKHMDGASVDHQSCSISVKISSSDFTQADVHGVVCMDVQQMWEKARTTGNFHHSAALAMSCSSQLLQQDGHPSSAEELLKQSPIMPLVEPVAIQLQRHDGSRQQAPCPASS